MKQEAAVAATQEQPRKRSLRVYSAREKTQAVLAAWSGRRSPSALSRELEVPWAVINSWEKRALSGMLRALDPKGRQTQAGQPSLPRRVERLLEQTVKPAAEPAQAG